MVREDALGGVRLSSRRNFIVNYFVVQNQNYGLQYLRALFLYLFIVEMPVHYAQQETRTNLPPFKRTHPHLKLDLKKILFDNLI